MHSNKRPNKEEQIKALIERRAHKLIARFVSPEQYGPNTYKEIFTVTKEDIIDYLKKRHELENNKLIFTIPGSKDGFYAMRLQNRFLIYEQYEGFRLNERIVATQDEVWNAYVDYILRTSGTGLKF